jgi:hypothetical protein
MFLLGVSADTDKEGKQLLSIMDFGGQCAYYACHQVYLNRRAFYILVLNMIQSFNEKVDRSLCEQQGTMFADWTYGGECIIFTRYISIVIHRARTCIGNSSSASDLS